MNRFTTMNGKKKILLVEDEKVMSNMIRLELEHNGFNVICGYDGEEGMRLVKEQPPDLILLDVMMPKKDGYQVCGELKAEESTRPIPVILLTAKGQQRDKDRGAQAGADAYIVKPFESEDLIHQINRLLGLS